MFLITFGIALGGIVFCVAIAFVLVRFFDPESQFRQVCLFLLIVPALISFLLGLGLGNNAFHVECDRITKTENRSEQAADRKPDHIPS